MNFKRGDLTPTGYVTTRDASWFSRPNVDSDKALHVECEDGQSACGIPTDPYARIPVEEVKTVCRRRACQKAFAALKITEGR